jgi:Na+-driven multidrug efflux pump
VPGPHPLALCGDLSGVVVDRRGFMQSHYRLDRASSDFAITGRANSSLCRFWQDFHLVRQVFSAAGPIWLTFAFGVLIAFNDLQIASRLGPPAQAAMGLCETVWYLFTLVASGIAGGIGTCVSQAVGADDKEKIRKFAVNGLAVSGIVGVLLLVATIVLARTLCHNLCGSPQAAAHAISYLELCAIGNLPYAIMQGQSAVFRSVGRPRLGLILWLIAAVVEIAGTQFNYSALSGCAARNLDGVAIFWDIGCFISVLVGFFILNELRKNDRIPSPNCMRDLSMEKVNQIISVGLPLVCGEAAIVIAQLCVYKLLGALPDGLHWQAIWAIKSRVEETLILSPLMALSLAVAAHTGFGLGAGKEAQAMKIAWRCAVAASSVSVVLAISVCSLAPHIVLIFAGTSELAQDGALVLSASALLWPLLALSIVLLGAFEGIGKTLKSTIFMGLTLLPLRLLMAAVMPFIMMPSFWSVFVVVGLPQLIAAAGMVILFRKERRE